MSGEFSLNVAMDAASLSMLHAFANYKAYLEPALLKAQDAGISMLQAYATDFMWQHFINPTGNTESAWDTQVESPYQSYAGNTAPQARRLEFGFSNMTDSLGRYFHYWPDYHWAQQTVILEQYKVAAIFQAAVDYANLQLGKATP